MKTSRASDSHPPDPVESLIRAAQPEMSRLARTAGLGFETRLRAALGKQTSALWWAWESAAWQGARMAAGVTVLIAVQFGASVAFQSGAEIHPTAWTIERTLLGM
jgi:hypothetical protein